MITANWARTGVVIGTIVFAQGVNYATNNAKLTGQSERIDRLEKRIDKSEEENNRRIERLTRIVNKMVTEVTVTSNTVSRIEKKLDRAINHENK